MTRAEIETAIADTEEWFTYHLSNAKDAEQNGALATAERNRIEAGREAAILTALKEMRRDIIERDSAEAVGYRD